MHAHEHTRIHTHTYTGTRAPTFPPTKTLILCLYVSLSINFLYHEIFLYIYLFCTVFLNLDPSYSSSLCPVNLVNPSPQTLPADIRKTLDFSSWEMIYDYLTPASKRFFSLRNTNTITFASAFPQKFRKLLKFYFLALLRSHRLTILRTQRSNISRTLSVSSWSFCWWYRCKVKQISPGRRVCWGQTARDIDLYGSFGRYIASHTRAVNTRSSSSRRR